MPKLWLPLRGVALPVLWLLTICDLVVKRSGEHAGALPVSKAESQTDPLPSGRVHLALDRPVAAFTR